MLGQLPSAVEWMEAAQSDSRAGLFVRGPGDAGQQGEGHSGLSVKGGHGEDFSCCVLCLWDGSSITQSTLDTPASYQAHL